MPRRFLQRKLPNMHSVLGNRRLRWIGLGLKDSDLFHLNRRSVSMAFLVGLFTAFLPVPGQLLIAALLAFAVRCNLPLAMALIFVSNPLTIPPLTLLCYRVGAFLLGNEAAPQQFHFTWEWLTGQGIHLLPTLLTGCLTLGAGSGITGYLAVRWLWRWHAVARWRQRKATRAATRSATPAPEAPQPPATQDRARPADSTPARPRPPERRRSRADP